MLTEEKRNVYLNNRDLILDRGHQYLLAQDWNLNDLAKEMNHLLGPRQSAQVTVDDDSVEAVVYEEQQPAEKLREQFHGNLILLGFGERCEP